MTNEYRKQLLGIKSRIEQQIAEAERIVVAAPDDEHVLGAAKQLPNLRRVLADVERKLHDTG
jgi:hypothetical protein